MHHDWTDEQRSISCKGRLVALRTKAESDASFETRRAYIVEIPLKSASKALECVFFISPLVTHANILTELLTRPSIQVTCIISGAL